ncbi:hypothetical protein NDU88_000968 [Pleurodeles waltl]|uniref:Uncharacterized protein n=1 Tax=Pleurodeles waltl TaxID=8319 RepID=A0AAV7KRM1_PLEWA|nr:hypothetical protein NDU88_000968 [Pleurodeles waltl]
MWTYRGRGHPKMDGHELPVGRGQETVPHLEAVEVHDAALTKEVTYPLAIRFLPGQEGRATGPGRSKLCCSQPTPENAGAVCEAAVATTGQFGAPT